MQIGTNYNVATGQTKFTPKAKETGSGDQVVLGGNLTDNTLSMADQLKNMKSSGDACDNALNQTAKIGGVGILGSIAGGVGGKFLASSLGACGFGTFAAVTGGILLGGFIGLEYGARKFEF